ANAMRMCQPNEIGARVGNGGYAGFRDQPGILTGQQRFEQGGQRSSLRVDVEFDDADFLQRFYEWNLRVDELQKSARGLGVFSDEIVELRRDALDIGWNDMCQRIGGFGLLAQRIGNEIEGARHVDGFYVLKNSTPVRRSMAVNAI